MPDTVTLLRSLGDFAVRTKELSKAMTTLRDDLAAQALREDHPSSAVQEIGGYPYYEAMRKPVRERGVRAGKPGRARSVYTTKSPAARTVAKAVAELIDTGEYAPGAALPAPEALAETHQANINTVHAALRALIDAGTLAEAGDGTLRVVDSAVVDSPLTNETYTALTDLAAVVSALGNDIAEFIAHAGASQAPVQAEPAQEHQRKQAVTTADTDSAEPAPVDTVLADTVPPVAESTAAPGQQDTQDDELIAEVWRRRDTLRGLSKTKLVNMLRKGVTRRIDGGIIDFDSAMPLKDWTDIELAEAILRMEFSGLIDTDKVRHRPHPTL
ncbi:GntR family transcriptional regulator [Nocardia sp. NPDC049220]|uniref:GntR family transcriptional regulator n=1 Tax=Nocardia sp. NPDC049220 TaxID=3155273 RepID=UPI0033C57FA6